MRRAFVPILFLLLGLRGIAHAQTPPVQNTDSYSDRNVTVQFGMKLDNATPAPGTKVSGTKVETSFWAEARQNGTTPAAPAQPWTHADLDVSVTCGDASPALDLKDYYPSASQNSPDGVPLAMVPDAAEPEAPVPQVAVTAQISGGARPVRIASTEFGDGSTIHFLITCKIHFARIVNDVTLDSKIVERKIVATLTACNRLLLLATNEEWNGSAYVTNPMSPTQPLYKNAAAAAMPLVRPFWDAVHHTIFPEAGKETKWGENAANPDTVWRTQNLDAEMSKYTAFFAFTHGEDTNPVHFRASVGPNTVTDGQVIGNEIRSYADAARVIPLYQIAIFYACSLDGATSLIYGFRMDTNNQPWRAIAGFPRVVVYQLYGSTTTLDQHAKKLMEFLSQGYPLAWALQKVQGPSSSLGLNMVPKDKNNGSMLMKAPGPYISNRYPEGNYTRLRYVYLEPEKYNADTTTTSQRNTWFYLYDF